MGSILDLCAHYNVPVLEDAAEALGATYKGRAAGTLGDVRGFISFIATRSSPRPAVGMLVSSRRDLIEEGPLTGHAGARPRRRLRTFRDRLQLPDEQCLAGIGRGQLQVLSERVHQRRSIALRYRDAFAHLPGIALMPQSSYGLHTNWLSCFLIDEESSACSRDELIASLDAPESNPDRSGSRCTFNGLYNSAQCYGGAVGEDLFLRGICLPAPVACRTPIRTAL
jgi:pyridoxal phosphate-dependent aminotransferase EpsN